MQFIQMMAQNFQVAYRFNSKTMIACNIIQLISTAYVGFVTPSVVINGMYTVCTHLI